MEAWLWIGVAGMALGVISIAWLTIQSPEGERHHGVTSLFVCLIAMIAYLAMAFGQGSVEIDGKEVFVARYIDWVLTTPLLLLGLLTLGLAPLARGGDVRNRNALIAGVLGADVVMIVTGFLATVSPLDAQKWVWFGISCLAFFYVIRTLWGPVYKEAVKNKTGGLYIKLLGVLSLLWFVYPVLWVLGTECTDTISLNAEVGVYAVIDVTAKVLFGLMLVAGSSMLAKKK